MKKYFKFLLVLVMFIAMPVFALSTDLFKADNTVNVSEGMDGSGFVAGNFVDVNTKVNGILFAAGNEVKTSGISDYAFIAGNIIKVNNHNFRDGFIAGSSIDIEGSTIERDLYVTGERININSNIGRHVYLSGSNIIINGKVNGNVTAYGKTVTVGDNAVITGTLKYSEDSELKISDNATIGNKVAEKSTQLDVNVGKVSFVSRISSMFISLSNILLIGLLLMLFMPKNFEKIKEMKSNSILKSLGFGFLTLIAVPIASIILLITVVGVSTSLISLLFYFASIYLSTVFTSYYLANLTIGNKVKNKYLLFIIGAFVISILKLIPFVGILVSICSLLIGLGLIVILLFDRK